MGLFEDMFIKAKSAAEVAGEKAGKIVDVSKLNIEMAELKGELKTKFENLGKIVYHSNRSGSDDEGIDGVVDGQISEIDVLCARIEELKDQIAHLKNKVICKICGYHNNDEALYCSKCGSVLEIKCECKDQVDDEESNSTYDKGTYEKEIKDKDTDIDLKSDDE